MSVSCLKRQSVNDLADYNALLNDFTDKKISYGRFVNATKDILMYHAYALVIPVQGMLESLTNAARIDDNARTGAKLMDKFIM